ncbi:hypothetical protein [Pseudarthrobacter albicanus]|nr:hypothetical protein [Pseudarthrobacter albicanus]
MAAPATPTPTESPEPPAVAAALGENRLGECVAANGLQGGN